MLGEEARFLEDLPRAEALDPVFRVVRAFVDGSELPVGSYLVLHFLSELVHGVEFGTLFGQPD